MKFGPASPADAIGGVTVHTLRQGSLVLKKGTTVGPAEVEALKKAGVKEVVVVRLEKGDVSEDEAAASIAKAVAGEGVNVERAFTGRSNLFAAQAGVLVVDRAAVDRINIPQDALDRISELMSPGASLIISDQGLGPETGKGTDFIVLTR